MPRGTDETIDYALERIHDEYEYYGPDAFTLATDVVEGLIAEGRISNDNINLELDGYFEGEYEPLPEPDLDLTEYDNDTGVLTMGGNFKGAKHIKEKETDTFYCPSENYCLLKCYEKYLEYKGRPDIKFSRVGLNAYTETKRQYNKVVSDRLCPRRKDETKEDYTVRKNNILQKLPPIFKMTKVNDNVKLTAVDSHHKVKHHKYRIGLINIAKNSYHAILLKKFKNLKVKDIKLEYTYEVELNNDWKMLKKNSIKSRKDLVVVYDIETYSKNIKVTFNKGSKKEVERDCQDLVPIALGYQVISNLKSISNKKYGTPIIGEYHEVFSPDNEIFEVFFEDMLKRYKDVFKDEKEIQIFAHNGSKFDNIFLKLCKKVKFTDQIAQGSNLKMIKCKYVDDPDLSFVFKDTLPFCLASLKNIAVTLKCTPKMNFDIAGWSKQKYLDNMETTNPELNWRKYLQQDVETLSEVFIKLETMYHTLGCSITNNLGLPGIAYELMNKTCFAMTEKTYIPKDPTMVQLILNATYGGRVQCLKRRFNDPNDKLISLDVNSEYPYGMTMPFPVGLPILVTDENRKRFLEEFEEHTDGKISFAPHFILTIKYRVPNLKISIIPQKDEGKLYYPSNGEFIGSYNDVDIREMLIDGYEILEIINGIYWAQSERIFTNLIEDIYTTRQKLKAEKSEMEYTYKIAINAMFGKNLETIKSVSYFSDSSPVGSNTVILNNGQHQVTKRLDNPIVKKPIQYGCYILSYGRAILNEYIRKLGIENIYYSDTDSLYVPFSVFKKSGIEESLRLGGIKNDYGDNVFISEAIFLDIKRYFLQKQDLNSTKDKTPISNKFIGLNFRDLFNENYTSNGGLVCDTEEKKKIIKDFYNELAKNYDDYIIDLKTDREASIKRISLIFNKWARTSLDVKIIKSELLYSIDPKKKGILVPDEKCEYQFISLGYDPDKEEDKHGINEHTLDYYKEKARFSPCKVIGTKDKLYLKSALPVTTSLTKGILYNNKINMILADTLGIKTDFYLFKDNDETKIINVQEIRKNLKPEEKDPTIIAETYKDYILFYTVIGDKTYSVDRYEGLANSKYTMNEVNIHYKKRLFYITSKYGASIRIKIKKEQFENMYPIFGMKEGILLKNTSSSDPKEIKQTMNIVDSIDSHILKH